MKQGAKKGWNRGRNRRHKRGQNEGRKGGKIFFIARINFFGGYLQYFCIFECYCKNISLWEGVLQYFCIFEWQEYFTLGGCAGLDIYNIFVYLNVMQENFNLGGCAGLKIYNIFVYLNVILFHFGNIIMACYCKWEGVLAFLQKKLQ